MRTSEVVELFDNNMSELGRFLGIGRSAVQQWGEFVPPLRQYQLREKRPKIDKELVTLRARKRRAAA